MQDVTVIDSPVLDFFKSSISTASPDTIQDRLEHSRRASDIIDRHGGRHLDRMRALLHEAGDLFGIDAVVAAFGEDVRDALLLPCPFTQGPEDFESRLEALEEMSPGLKAIALANILDELATIRSTVAARRPAAPAPILAFEDAARIVEMCRRHFGIQPLIREVHAAILETASLVRTYGAASGSASSGEPSPG